MTTESLSAPVAWSRIEVEPEPTPATSTPTEPEPEAEPNLADVIASNIEARRVAQAAKPNRAQRRQAKYGGRRSW